MGQCAYLLGRNPGDMLCPLWGIVLYPVFQQLESWLDLGAVIQLELTQEIGITTGRVGTHGNIELPIPPEFVFRIETALLVVHLHPLEQSMVVPRWVVHNQFGRVSVLHQEFPVIQTLLDQLMSNGQQQGAIRARLDRNPLVRDRRVAGTNRVYRDKTTTPTLELGQGHFHRVGVVVLGCTDHDKQLGPVEIRPTELPEGSTDGVDETGCHVYRAKTAMSCIVGCTELLGEHAGQRLHLVASGKQGELLRIRLAQPAQALFHDVECLVP